MPTKTSYSDVEKWSVEELIDATNPAPQGKRRVTIPEFQRRLVWSKGKQEKLITSIKAGFPFGSLLVYEDVVAGNQEGKRHYKLIDGLQRTQALREYIANPNSFFSRDDVPDSLIDVIKRELDVHEIVDENIKKTVVGWVKQRKGFRETDGWGIDGLISHLVRELLELEAESNDYYTMYGRVSSSGTFKDRVAQFLLEIRESTDIGGAKLPVIVYNGPASELPTVFELLNSQGTALSRYEIYAAQWIDQRRKIENGKIIDAIWRKYEALEDEGFTLDVSEEAPDKKTRREREYTLFEYLFGFGQFLASEYPTLFKPVAPDQPSSAGFNLVAACINLNVQEMDKLPKQLGELDRDRLEKGIIECIRFVDNALSPILHVRKQSNDKPTIYHTEYQIVSFIATAFKVRFELPYLTEREGWRTKFDQLQHQGVMYYLYDILRDYWRGTGDTKLHEAVSTLRYLSPAPNSDNWEQVLDTWFSDSQITMQHTRRNIRDVMLEVLFLKYIYVHKFTLMENSEKYHIEHIIPIDRLLKIMDENDKWPLNAVSNLALLWAKDNMKKRDRTFVEYLESQRLQGTLFEEDFAEELARHEDQLLCPSELVPSEISWETFQDFLLARFDYLKHEFFRVWKDRIPSSNA